jgi:sugar phosphate isomerase/epimerase
MTSNKRNHFNYLILILSAFMLFLSLDSLGQKPKKNIGLQLWSVRDTIKVDTKGTIESLGKMGYSFVEAAGYSDGKFYGMEPADFKALVEKNGMKFLSSHTGQPVPDSASWNKTMAWWDQAIAAHKAAGVKYIVQPFMTNEAYESIPVLQAYCKYFNAVGEKCNAAGIRFGYHNHDKEFSQLGSVTIYDYMLKNTDPKKVMFEMDLYWITIGKQKPIDYFNKYPKRFVLWHVKDEKELGNNPIMDFKPIFAAAKKSGMKHYIVEVERYDFPPLVSVKKSIDFLNNASYVK